MASTLMGVNGKWFDMMDTNTMSYDDIIGFVKEHEAVSEGGRCHKPIKHSLLLSEFRDRANKVGLTLVNTKVALSRDGMKFMCVSDTKETNRGDYSLSVGMRNSSNSTQAFSGAVASTVACCSNGIFQGFLRPSKQRNTINNYDQFGHKIDIIFERFNNSKDDISGQIELMKQTKLTDGIIGKFLTSLIKEGSIGNTHICDIVRELDNPTVNSKNDDSCFRLVNAGTWVTEHDIKNPYLRMNASNLINNTIMGIVKDGFVPLGDDIVEGEIIEA